MAQMFTREEFEKHRAQLATEMARDTELRRKTLEVLLKADRYSWIHQPNWFGEPFLQLPHDILALQEIVFRTRPKFIVECGVAWGGSLLFYATLLEALRGGRVIGIDIHVPEDLKERVGSHGRISERITWIHGSSIEETTVRQVKSMVGEAKEVMVILDSFHTHEHVLKELKLYAPLVGKGFYLVCFDTYLDDIPEIVQNRPRPWGANNNPRTALTQFLKEEGGFEVDVQLENKLLFSLAPGGYLRRCRD